jgi:hypothetical protein
MIAEYFLFEGEPTVVTKTVIFRHTAETEAIWQRVWKVRGMPTGNAAWADILNRLDEATQSKLEGKSLQKYLAGELTRAEWKNACIAYHQVRKNADAPDEQAVLA